MTEMLIIQRNALAPLILFAKDFLSMPTAMNLLQGHLVDVHTVKSPLADVWTVMAW
jgi:hypothetical protein